MFMETNILCMVEMSSDLKVLATELVKRVNGETRRTRLLEQKVDRFEAEISNLENTIKSQNSDLKNVLQNFEDTLKEISNRVLIMENSIKRIEKELSKKATKNEFKTIESYMELMSPITGNYVTRAEMERVISEKTQKKF